MGFVKRLLRSRARKSRPLAHDALAFDRASVRRTDLDGHLHVEMTPISKANVCPYWGREIPDFEKLGLDPEEQYRLYRDPKELAKAASSFAGKPLLLQHTPISADDHPREMTVGSVGDEVNFKPPYLMAPLHIHDGEAIGLVNSGEQKELSSAYRYRADMTPGKTPDGEAYDGVMRDIIGNHVALVREGRAGPDVIVGDSKGEAPMDLREAASRSTTPQESAASLQREMASRKRGSSGSGKTKHDPSKGQFASDNGDQDMKMLTRKGAAAHGALMVYLAPKLAQDAKVDLGPTLTGVTTKNFKAKRPEIAKGVLAAAKGKLAQDAEIDTKDLAKVLDVIEMLEPTEASSVEDTDTPDNAIEYDDADAELRAMLKAKGLSDEEIGRICAMGAGATDESEEDRKKREADEKKAAEDKKAKDERDEKAAKMIDKKAMDTAIAGAVKVATDAANANQVAIREAERAVRPYVGELKIACDSAEKVFRTALEIIGVKGANTVHASALQTILEMQPLPGARTQPRRDVAMDASIAESFAKRYPDAARIRVL